MFIGEQELSEAVFGVALNKGLVHQAMVAQLATFIYYCRYQRFGEKERRW